MKCCTVTVTAVTEARVTCGTTLQHMFPVPLDLSWYPTVRLKERLMKDRGELAERVAKRQDAEALYGAEVVRSCYLYLL